MHKQAINPVCVESHEMHYYNIIRNCQKRFIVRKLCEFYNLVVKQSEQKSI